jgi:hypothetical protein
MDGNARLAAERAATLARRKGNAHSLVSLFILVSSILMHSQVGPCTETAIKQGDIPLADDAFRICPHSESLCLANPQFKIPAKFAGRTNIKHSYLGEHRIVSSASGDRAYEYGTLDVSFDSKDDGQRHEFKAVIP